MQSRTRQGAKSPRCWSSYLPLIAFSPRKAAYSLYGFTGTEGADELLVKLGKHTTGKSCLYVKKLKDVDLKILEALAANALAARKTN